MDRPSTVLPYSHSPSGSAGSGSSSGWHSRSPRAWCNHRGSHACYRRLPPCLQRHNTAMTATQWIDWTLRYFDFWLWSSANENGWHAALNHYRASLMISSRFHSGLEFLLTLVSNFVYLYIYIYNIDVSVPVGQGSPRIRFTGTARTISDISEPQASTQTIWHVLFHTLEAHQS